MSIEKCNGFLEAMALLNEGVNCGPTYTVELLPEAPSLEEALALYFSSQSTSNVPEQPAQAWGIRIQPLDADWRLGLEKVIHGWFFDIEYSPVTKFDGVSRMVTAAFMDLLVKLIAGGAAFGVHVSPPMWYEMTWRDFAFDCGNKRYLLHFGISD